MTESNPKNIELTNKEFEFDPKSIAVVTATRYPEYKGFIDTNAISSLTPAQIADTDTIRGNLALQTVREASKRGYNMLVSEGGSNQAFLDDLHNIAGVTVLKRPKPQRAVGKRQVYETAAGIPDIQATVWLEAEKTPLVPFVPNIVQPILQDEADIIIIGREEKIWKDTWPPYMYQMEKEANQKWNGILHTFSLLPQNENLHMFCGPRAFRNSPEMVDIWTEKYSFDPGPSESENPTGWKFVRRFVKPEEYSDGQFFPVVKALYQRLIDPTHGPRVINVDLPFEYPEIQRLNEMTPEKEAQFLEKRKDQFYGFMVETVHYIRYLMGPNAEKSKLHLMDHE